MTTPNKRKKPALAVDMESNGLVPPQSIEIEEVVLGAMLLEKEAVQTVIDILEPECFYKEQNQLIYRAITEMYKKNEPIDLVTITKQLHSAGQLEEVGGAYYISTLTNRIASSANVEYHARILLQHHMKRELIRINVRNIKRAYTPSEDVFELYSEQSQEMDMCLKGVIKHEAVKISNAHADSIQSHQEALKSGVVLGVPTGFYHVDKFTGGWQPSDLIVIAARPGMGKTALVTACAKNAAIIYKKPTLVFSLEMPTRQLTDRIQSDLSEIELSKIQKRQLNEQEIAQMNGDCEQLWDAPLYIDDSPALNLLSLKAKARRAKEKYKIELIIIDYLQLMSGSGDSKGNREQEIGEISRGLKALAKELDLPIIALSQLSRNVESRPGRKPQLSDLRESGAIEQDADMVLFCFRPWYYEIEEYQNGNESFQTSVQHSAQEGYSEYTTGLFVLIVAKNRNGGLGDLFLGWVAHLAKLTDYDFVKMDAMWKPRLSKSSKQTAPVQKMNQSPNENKNLDEKLKNDTFVQQGKKEEISEQGMNKMQQNNDFLSQKNERDNMPDPEDFDTIPFL